MHESRCSATNLIAGVDEAGRGPLAGSVVAAAVILDPEVQIEGLNDSKKLSEKRRKLLETEIKSKAGSWAIGIASVQEIDQLNILWASMLAMQRALQNLPTRPTRVLVDGNRCPETDLSCEAIVGGDASVAAISAASILAKVARDRSMLKLHAEFPEYGYDRHKGYPTARHLAALKQHGVSVHHRRSFGPVAALLDRAAVVG